MTSTRKLAIGGSPSWSFREPSRLGRTRKKTGDFEKLIRGERRDKWAVKRTGLGIEANVLLRNDETNGSARLCIKPRDLISAMYTQPALAVDGGVNLRCCVECRRWFALDAGRGRSDKEYCSDACRMRAYRKRKGRAARKPTRSKKR